ncbi:MAG: ArsR/SmtB family transcription factor [Candidatus Nanohaloarchaea archaeon]
MVELLRRNGKDEILDAGELGPEELKALTDRTRLKILRKLAGNPSYPSEIAEELGIEKQNAYYHFRKLEGAGLLEVDRKEERSGGVATFYRPSRGAYALDLGGEGSEIFLPDRGAQKFLTPLVEDGELRGSIVVGSPDQHGPDQVRARDGHLAAEIGLKLGQYGDSEGVDTMLDTELFRDSEFDQNMILLGGVLTNTATKKFNREFPSYFSGESFPYREIKTPRSKYSEDTIGLIARTEHPGDPEKALYMVAGIRNKGTEAAVRAFKNLESLLDDYEEGEFHRVVRGLDLDGDGEIDDYEVVE